MAAIDNYLQQIRTAVYGRDVRSAIANGIEECYARDRDITVTASSTVDGIEGTNVNRLAACSSSAAAVNKTASIVSGSFHLVNGARVTILFAEANLADAPTLNVNGTGAKPIYFHGARLYSSDTVTLAGACDFVYDTALQAWHLIGGSEIPEETDLRNYPTKSEMNTAIAAAVEDAQVDLTPYLRTATADLRYASSSTNSFQYMICPNSAGAIPKGITNVNGLTGTLNPSIDTMYTIYLVQVRTIPNHFYDAYITVRTTSAVFRWERVGGEYIDLSPYITADDVAADYATKNYVDDLVDDAIEQTRVDLTPYITKAQADRSYADINVNSFQYQTCSNTAGSIPAGVVNAAGTVGTLEASASTMFAIYLVPVRSTMRHTYDSYITVPVGNAYRWEKIGGDDIDLSGYLTAAEIAAGYAQIEYVNNYVDTAIEDAAVDMTLYLSKTEAAQTYASIDNNSFNYHVCMNAPDSIPYGITNSYGTVGILRASANTMYDVYMVSARSGDKSAFDEYITIELNGNYVWEKLGGQTIDLTQYLTAAAIAEDYVTKASLNIRLSSYLTSENAAATFATLDSLQNYATKNYVDSQISQAMTGGELNLDDYLTKGDAALTYATIGAMNQVIKNGDLSTNAVYLLQLNDIPGTSQQIIFSQSGDVQEIRHIREQQSIRVDTFTFGIETITEVRTIATGERMTIATNTNTLVTTITYAAA